VFKKMIFPIVAAVSLTHSVSSAVEWRFRSAALPDQPIIFLSEEPSTNRACAGKQTATEQIYTLERWVFVRDLCWEIDKPGTLKFTDPEKVKFFNTFTRPAASFIKIPSKKELAEAAEREESNRRTRSMNEGIRQLNEEIDRNQRRNDEIRRQQSQRRAPIFCSHFGDTSICD